ncbi:MAG: hypothetical protein KF699_16290, partial [Phycisphaeraceae bacterium]|nr:hypothetical protein [Phycisphaeraceae bacterium]
LVFNGGFEQGFAGWSVPPNAPPGPNGANFQTPTDNPHSGLRYAQLSSAQLQFISQFLPGTVAGTDYELEFWLRVPSNVPSTLVVRWEGQAVFHTPTLLPSANTWYPFTVPLHANFTGSLLEFGQAIFPLEYHVDDIVVRQVPAPSILSLLGVGALAMLPRRRR